MPVTTRGTARRIAEEYVRSLQNARSYVSARFDADGCPEISPKEFIIVCKLGAGGFGQVYKCETNAVPNTRFVAAKLIPKAGMAVTKVRAEKTMLWALKHSSIVECYGYFEDWDRIVIYMELAPFGDFWRLLEHSNGEIIPLQEQIAEWYLGQIVLALEFIHAANVIYGDLKPENVMLFAGGRLKLADFGLADFNTMGVCRRKGTFEFMAPEIFEGDTWSCAVDWWALGVVMCIVLEGVYPFIGETDDEVQDTINEESLKQVHTYKISGAAKDIILKFLKLDFVERLGHGEDGIRVIKAHPFFKHIDFDFLMLPSSFVPYFELKELKATADAQAGNAMDTVSIPSVRDQSMDVG